MPPKQPKVVTPSDDEEENNAGTSASTATTTVYKIPPKIPPFWNEQPAAWFILIEHQFTIHGITDDDERFVYTLGAIPQETIQFITDIFRNPQPGHKYNRLKSALTNRYTISEEQRLDELLSGFQQMGDLRPSHFYRLLEQKAGDSKLVNNDLLKNLWLKRLPDDLRAILARDIRNDIEEVLPVADQIWIYAQSRAPKPIAAVNQPSTSKATADGEPALVSMQRQLDKTQQQLADLQRTLANINIGSRGRSPNNRPNFNYRRRSRSRSSSRPGLCYYHRRFGLRARNCNKPCNFRPVAHGEATYKNSKSSENR